MLRPSSARALPSPSSVAAMTAAESMEMPRARRDVVARARLTPLTRTESTIKTADAWSPSRQSRSVPEEARAAAPARRSPSADAPRTASAPRARATSPTRKGDLCQVGSIRQASPDGFAHGQDAIDVTAMRLVSVAPLVLDGHSGSSYVRAFDLDRPSRPGDRANEPVPSQ